MTQHARDKAPFDPNDPFDLHADALRRSVIDLALSALNSPGFKAMPPEQQFSCLICGIMTGLMGCVHSSVTPDGHAAAEQMVRAYVAEASAHSIAILHSTGANLDG